MAATHENEQAVAAPTLSTATAASAPRASDEDSRVESPSLSTPSARARFEFERERGNDGTKVLMVEWEDDETTKEISGSWTVGWERKSHILPAAEERPASSPVSETSHGSSTSTPLRQTSHRLYFLLPVRRQVPATVTLTLTPTNSSLSPVVWKTNPLPAIYPPGFATDDTRGKGVLHNLWAKKRLQALNQEIEQEAKLNCEGIALQMALSEKEWIEDNFGLSAPKPLSSLQIRTVSQHELPTAPMSPLSPGGSRLSEKLRGLKLQTSGDAERSLDLPLTSPEEADVAVPLCQRKRERLVANHTAPAPVKPVAAVPNPSRFVTQPSSTPMMSLGSVLSGQTFMEPAPREEEEELFALPLSPRSPEMTKSPFSFAADDTRRYLAQSVV